MEACGQRGLGHEEGLGGTADAAPARHLEEALDLDELDATSLAVTRFVYGHGGEPKFYLWVRRERGTSSLSPSGERAGERGVSLAPPPSPDGEASWCSSCSAF